MPPPRNHGVSGESLFAYGQQGPLVAQNGFWSRHAFAKGPHVYEVHHQAADRNLLRILFRKVPLIWHDVMWNV
eukprot:11996027-Karenia_brevis.AAC.1